MVDPVTIVISGLISSIVGGLTVAIYTNAKADARDDKKLQHDAEQKD